MTYLLVLHIFAVYFLVDSVSKRYLDREEPVTAVAPVSEATGDGPPLSSVSPDPTTNTRAESTPNPPIANPTGLIIPVLGVKPEQLTNSFSDARSEGRVHDAIDIPAAAGTPVLAAADGEIVQFRESVPGGITIYQLSADRKYVYYYAHLQRRADDVKVGDVVKQGTTIAFVGDTGNAGAGNYHLHFSIAAVADPKRYWEGVYLDPFPLLKDQGRLP